MKKIGCIFLLGFLLLSGCSNHESKVQEENIDPNSILDEVIAELDGCKSYVIEENNEGNWLETTIPNTLSDLKVTEVYKHTREIEVLNEKENDYNVSNNLGEDIYYVTKNYPEKGREYFDLKQSKEGMSYVGDSYGEHSYSEMRFIQKMIVEVKENKFFESKSEKIGDNIIITYFLKDVDGYNQHRIEEFEAQGRDREELLWVAGGVTSKNELTRFDYTFTINEDHQLIQYETYGTRDFGDGLETWDKTLDTIERKDVDLDAKKIDAIIEKAKSGALKDGDIVDW